MSVITRTATIANGQSLSAAVELVDGASIVGIVMPAAWTTAVLTMQMSHDDSTYNNVYDSLGNEATIQAGASRYIVLNPSDYIGADALKIRSGTSGSPVNQDAERRIVLVLYAP